MTIGYRLVGYDKETERKSNEVAIPDEDLPAIVEVAGILPTDDGLGDYPLDDEQAKAIARILKTTIDCGSFVYCVEPYEIPAAKFRRRRAG
jgi:hypothetical protein